MSSDLALISPKSKTFNDESIEGICLIDLQGICKLQDGIEKYFGRENGYGDSLLRDCTSDADRSSEFFRCR